MVKTGQFYRRQQAKVIRRDRFVLVVISIFLILGNMIQSSQSWVMIKHAARAECVRNHESRLYRACSFLHGSHFEDPDTQAKIGSACKVKLKDLQDMDVVVYSLAKNNADAEEPQYCLGALQEDGVLSPLSAWTDEPAFGDSIEFLVDEVDRFTLARETKEQRQQDEIADDATTTIRIHHLLSEAQVSYGSRQCPRGPHNPHGEESELLYYVEQGLIDQFEIRVIVKPDLEILW